MAAFRGPRSWPSISTLRRSSSRSARRSWRSTAIELAELGTLAAAVTVAYPILHLATAGAGLVALLAARSVLRAARGYLLLAGFAVVGFAWVEWLRQAAIRLAACRQPR